MPCDNENSGNYEHSLEVLISRTAPLHKNRFQLSGPRYRQKPPNARDGMQAKAARPLLFLLQLA